MVREAKGYLFDTTPCIRLRRGDPKILERLRRVEPEAEIYTSVITVGELYHYIFKAPLEHRRALIERTEELLQSFTGILGVTEEVARVYGEIVAKLPPGQFIGQNDCWIAAIAKANGLILVTNDKDFERVEGLEVEDWLQ